MKNRAEMLAGKLRPNQVLERPWQHISVDFITKLPMSKGYDLILVVCDRFSKIFHFVAMTEKTTAEGLARLFRDNMWKLHGLPESVILDRCYELKPLGLDNRTTLVLSNTRELNRKLFYKLVYLI